MNKGIRFTGFFFAAFLFSGLAYSGTYCESSVIDKLNIVQGNESEVRIVTLGSRPDSRKIRTAYGYATLIKYDSPTRFRDRLSMLKLAFALELPVSIWSSDGNCMGPSDEFSVAVCKSTGCDLL